MREIKFRAWDGNEMVYDWFAIDRSTLDTMVPFQRHNVAKEVMQYTGLKDKNGKEIYEGDILMNRFSPGREERLVLTHDIFFIIHRLRTLQHERKNDLNQTLEIIGNVYESPELLSTQPSQE